MQFMQIQRDQLSIEALLSRDSCITIMQSRIKCWQLSNGNCLVKHMVWQLTRGEKSRKKESVGGKKCVCYKSFYC